MTSYKDFSTGFLQEYFLKYIVRSLYFKNYNMRLVCSLFLLVSSYSLYSQNLYESLGNKNDSLYIKATLSALNEAKKKSFSQSSNYVTLTQLNEQISRTNRRVDSTLRANTDTIIKLRQRIGEVEERNNGRFESLQVWLGIYLAIILLLFGYNAITASSRAKSEARNAFKEDFDFYCKKIVEQSEKADRLLSEIQSAHQTVLSIKDEALDAVEKIKLNYQKS